MEENVRLLNDLDNLMDFIITENLDGVYYRGNVIKYAEKYGIEPVRAKNGRFILTRHDIFQAMTDQAMKNFLAIKKIID